MVSKRYSLNKEDFSKIITGAVIALGGALLTYISTIIIEIDFGEFTPVVVAIASILINTGRKFLEGRK